MSKFYFDQDKRFIIEDYNHTRPFASFLPGIAGVNGIPMWVYYVNRGQGVASFGVENKNGCIMEFLPADKSYQITPYKGFRTFIKWTKNDHTEMIEPFTGDKDGFETMAISPNELDLSYDNEKMGIRVDVSYFTMPNENFAALVRRVSISNKAPDARKIEVLDGIPAIMPYGIDYMLYKSFGNTIKSWMDVFNLENDIPFYKVRASIVDSSEVGEITGGHFYLSFIPESKGSALKPIIDTDLIFGQNTSLGYPDRFLECGIDKLTNERQITTNKVPCGFTGITQELAPSGELVLYTIIGHVSSIDHINRNLRQYADATYIEKKRNEANGLIENLTDNAACRTSSDLFDAFARQCYLDNVLRGGYPLILENGKEPFVYHVFSRKHGDLERDYNFFSLAAEFYSQGNGNFRDANQNRKNDCWFNPRVGDFNIKMFMNLIQLDGYNPLVVKGCTFKMSEEGINKVTTLFDEIDRQKMSDFFKKPYTPGKLTKFISDHDSKTTIPVDQVLKEALFHSVQNIEADFGEGYWSDHWTYNMDLIESYLSVFPENKLPMLFDKKEYMYYDSYVSVAPRKDKYVYVNGKVRQYDAITEDEHKKVLIDNRNELRTWVRTGHGNGEIYRTNLYEKLLCLALVKFSTLDPFGMGIEMEGDKPGWDDSMNGLPGLFGSGMSESFELKRILKFLWNTDKSPDSIISLPEEMSSLLSSTDALLDTYLKDQSENKDHIYWDQVSFKREEYREKTRCGLSGRMASISLGDINKVLQKFLSKLDAGIEKSIELGKGISPTYFTFEAVDHEFIRDENGQIKTTHKGRQNVRVLAFKPRKINYFLEGIVKSLKVMENPDDAKALFTKVRNSDIYDRKLKMYKLCAPLEQEPVEIGRVKAFTPGWLENESIFTHMEYKYILELLKVGLYDEFFEDMKNVLIPFLNPEIYGRSTIENSSFIASSANPDDSTHGKGYVARLSGSTAEFLSMLTIMTAGKEPFIMENSKLNLSLSPILPGWLFDEKGEITFKFLGSCDVTYINPGRKNTYGVKNARINRMELNMENGEIVNIDGSNIPSPYAKRIRDGEGRTLRCYMS